MELCEMHNKITERYIQVALDRMSDLPPDIAVSLRNENISGFATLANMVEIDYIEVPEELQGKGYGSQVLRILTQTADDMGVTLVLTSADSAEDEDWPMSSAELANWYSRYGFEGDRKMIRIPVSD
jgi:GNAT superfamily N-acetyltransferase